jgi:TonB family protein
MDDKAMGAFARWLAVGLMLACVGSKVQAQDSSPADTAAATSPPADDEAAISLPTTDDTMPAVTLPGDSPSMDPVRAISPPTGVDNYASRVRAKIKRSIVMPPEKIPEAVFDVEQLPTGQVIRVKLRSSSGNLTYNQAVERAIRKASPLPIPEPPMVAPRMLQLRFRARE